jgi:hypothetical protein
MNEVYDAPSEVYKVYHKKEKKQENQVDYVSQTFYFNFNLYIYVSLPSP